MNIVRSIVSILRFSLLKCMFNVYKRFKSSYIIMLQKLGNILVVRKILLSSIKSRTSLELHYLFIKFYGGLFGLN